MKQKILSMVIALSMIIILLPAVTITAHAYTADYTMTDIHNGTAMSSGDVISIGTAEELGYLSEIVNGGQNCSGVTFYLSNDIVLGHWEDVDADGVVDDGEIYNQSIASGGAAYTESNWTPIGISSGEFFRGTFDGNNHTVSGIYINNSNDYQGLFGYIDGGTVKNVGVIDSYIKGRVYVGSVAGYQTGGSSLEYCYNTGSVVGEGGIVGRQRDSSIKYCYNMGDIKGSSYTGGIIGTQYSSSTLEYCYNIGSVDGNTSGYIGGLMGYNSGGTVSACFNTGSVYGGGYLGGVVGINKDEVLDCYNTGTVNSNMNGYIGGIIGLNDNPSYGSTIGTVSNCYNTGSLMSTRARGVAGLNESGATITNCYYDKQMSGTSSGVAEGKLTSEMLGDLFGDTTTWTIDNSLYPRLKDPSGSTFEMDETDLAHVAATPLILAGTTDTYETVNTVASDFIMNKLNDVKWYNSTTTFDSSTEITDGTTISITESGKTITAKKNDAIKEITLKAASGTVDAVPILGPLWDGTMPAYDASYTFSGGDGTSDNPYLISTFTDLAQLSSNVNGGSAYDGKYFRMTNNITLNTDASSYEAWGTSVPSNEWIPIGASYSYSFKGIFDGDGHTVSGIYINTTDDYQGLFGYISNGTINNVSVVDSYISGGSNVGSIVGYSAGTITNCYNTSIIKGNDGGTSKGIGGIVGNNYGIVTSCNNTGSVTGNNGVIGGVVGLNRNTVTLCHNAGDVNGSDVYIGGVVGKNNTGSTITYSYNTGDISSSDSPVGGVVGRNWGSVSYCYNTVNITGDNGVGGITGYSYNGANVTACYNIGDITSSSSNAGGISGYSGGDIISSYNAGEVNGSDYIGGVAGWNAGGSMQDCYTTGTVTASTTHTGSIVGYNTGTMSGCYYDKQMCTVGGIEGSDSAGEAEGKLTSEMLGDLFGDTVTWTTDNNLYPRLQDPSGIAFDMDTTDAAYVSVSPVILGSTSDADYETIETVATDFSVSTKNGVQWTSSDTSTINISDGIATIASRGSGVTLTGTLGDISKTITMTIPTYTIGAVDDCTLTELTAGYVSGTQEEKTITITKTGTGDLTNLAVALSGTDADDFTITQPAESTLDETTTATTFTVKAKDGLSAGSYTATVTISADNMSDETFTVTQVVNHTYTIAGMSNQSFTELTAGYVSGEQEEKEISITKTGTGDLTNLAVALSGTDADDFTIIQPAESTLDETTTATTFTVKAKDALSVGSYTATVTITADNMSDETFTVTQVVAASSDAGLISVLSQTDITPGTEGGSDVSDAITWEISVANSVSEIGVSDISVAADATLNLYTDSDFSNEVRSSSAISLTEGETTEVYIKITAQDNTTIRYYAIAVARAASSDAELIEVLNQVINAGSEAGTIIVPKTASVNVSNSISNIDSDDIEVANGATITFYGEDNTFSTAENGTVSLTAGDETTVYIKVVAQDGTTTLYYVVEITRAASSEAGLITVLGQTDHTPGAESGDNPSDAITWEVSVGNSVSEVSVSDISAESKAVNLYTDSDYLSEVRSSSAISLSEGEETTVYIRVTADDTTTKYYAVAITRAASSEAGLISVLGQTDNTPGDEAGVRTSSAITWEISVANNVSEVGISDISATSTKVNLYKDSDYSSQVRTGSAISLSEGEKTTVYIKITAPDDVTIKYYAVGIFRAEDSNDSEHTNHDNDSDNDDDNGSNVIVDGNEYAAGKTSKTSENGQTKTIVTVDLDRLESILDSEEKGAVVTIPVSDSSDVAAGVLIGQTVKDMEDKEAALVIQTDTAAYTLPAGEIKIEHVSEQFGEDVDLSDIEVEVAIAEPSDDTVKVVDHAAEEGKFSLVAPAVEFKVTCHYDGKTVEVENYSTYVKRMIKIPDGVDSNAISTAIVVHADGTVRHVPTKITKIDGKYYAEINSLTNSVYTLIYNPVEFTDVEEHWAKDAVNDMVSRKVVTSQSDEIFRPNEEMTRAEFTAIAVRALGLEEGMGKNTFIDVSDSDWYCGYIKTAKAYHMITGYSDSYFGANDKITREQAMVIMARAMEISKLDADIADSEMITLLDSYFDSSNTSPYAKAGIASCIKTGVIAGKSENVLAPKDTITRAEAAVILQRLLQKSNLI